MNWGTEIPGLHFKNSFLSRGIQVLCRVANTFIEYSQLEGAHQDHWSPALYSCFCLSVSLQYISDLTCLFQRRCLAAPSTPQLPFPTHISVAFQETLGQDLKECKCFTVSCSPETHILGLWACAIPQSSLTAGMESGIKLSLASTEAKSGQSREQSTLEHLTCKVLWPSAVYGSTSSLSGCRVWGWGWNWLYSDSLFPYSSPKTREPLQN